MPDSSLDVEAEVRRRFEVKNSFQLPDGNLEFSVAYKEDTRSKFEDLSRTLAQAGIAASLTGDKDDAALVLKKEEQKTEKGSRFAVVLALLTVLTISAFAILWQLLYEQLVPGLPGSEIFLAFMLLMGGIIGAHEAGRRLVGRGGRAGTSGQYLIPGIPVLSLFLPSAGFLTLQRTPALNRDRLFDFVVAGPLMVVLASAVFYALGDLTSFQSTVPLSAEAANSTVSLNSNVLQMGIDGLLGGSLPAVAPGHVLLSPLGEVGTVGFILAFIMLLPMSAYDGGYLAALAFGENGGRTSTFISVLLLLVLDTPNYWALAVVVLVVAGRSIQLKLRDEVSPLSGSRRYLMVGCLILAFLCLPIPKNFAGLV